MLPHLRLLDNNTIEINKSDAHQTILPDPETEKVEDGEVDYLAVADEKSKAFWLKRLGTYLMFDGRGQWNNCNDQVVYQLSRFPDGYRLYTHKKGDKSTPRKDKYLYGAADKKVFRSPAEFVLHLKWLALGMPMASGKPQCECTYCSGTPQSEIHDRMMRATDHLRKESAVSRKQTTGIRRSRKQTRQDVVHT